MSFWLPGIKPDIMASFHCPRFGHPPGDYKPISGHSKRKTYLSKRNAALDVRSGISKCN